jgi:hypothetical protein
VRAGEEVGGGGGTLRVRRWGGLSWWGRNNYWRRGRKGNRGGGRKGRFEFLSLMKMWQQSNILNWGEERME